MIYRSIKRKNVYERISDEELQAISLTGDKAAESCLVARYAVHVRRLAAPLYICGGDKDDLIQEGNVGLYEAILRFDPKKDVRFATFADLCIRRAQYKAIENSNRKKHAPLNFHISIDMFDENTESFDGKPAADDSLNPEMILIDRERSQQVYDRIIQALSPLELTVLKQYLTGMDYVQIADVLGKEKKSIDNALQRIRRKVKQICMEE